MKVLEDTEKVAKIKNKEKLIDDLMFGETDANQILEQHREKVSDQSEASICQPMRALYCVSGDRGGSPRAQHCRHRGPGPGRLPLASQYYSCHFLDDWTLETAFKSCLKELSAAGLQLVQRQHPGGWARGLGGLNGAKNGLVLLRVMMRLIMTVIIPESSAKMR